MGKLALTVATAAVLSAGALAFQAQAQTSRSASLFGSALQNFTPIVKPEPAACRGWGRCPPGRVWACGPRGCWCRLC